MSKPPVPPGSSRFHRLCPLASGQMQALRLLRSVRRTGVGPGSTSSRTLVLLAVRFSAGAHKPTDGCQRVQVRRSPLVPASVGRSRRSRRGIARSAGTASAGDAGRGCGGSGVPGWIWSPPRSRFTGAPPLCSRSRTDWWIRCTTPPASRAAADQRRCAADRRQTSGFAAQPPASRAAAGGGLGAANVLRGVSCAAYPSASTDRRPTGRSARAVQPANSTPAMAFFPRRITIR